MKLWFSVQVMVIGMVVVFVGLIILIGAIKVLSAVLRGKGEKKVSPAPAAPAIAPAAPVQASPAPAALAPVGEDLSVIAILMATILASEGSKDGKKLIVRSVRRLGGNAWAGAGRRDQMGV